MDPVWPPLELTVDGGMAPTLGHLKRPLCAKLGLGGPDFNAHNNVSMFKYSTQTYSWHELLPGMKASTTGTKTTITSKTIKKQENILQPPYSFKEGDLVCAFENKFSSKSTITSTGIVVPSKPVIVCRPEDLYFRESKKLEKNTKRNQGVTKLNGSNKRVKKPATEIALSLGGNLDFSDDEFDEN